MQKMKLLSAVSMLATVFSIAGCASDGTIVKEDGTTDEPKWHQWDKVTFDNVKGTFPNLQGLSQVRDGMTKDQLYELLGRPQYQDGWRPNQWNYLFHFTTPGQGRNGITTCQYKVLFDRDGYARSFYWHPISKEDGVCPPDRKVVPVKNTFKLSGDALFAFDKSGVGDLQRDGRKALDLLAEELKGYKELKSVKIDGYTDRLGSPAHNLRLSQSRANTVKQYLVSKGIPASIIKTEGRGAANQVAACGGIRNSKELRDCLLPNRRVEVTAQGIR